MKAIQQLSSSIVRLTLLTLISTVVCGQESKLAKELPVIQIRAIPAYPVLAVAKNIHGVVYADVEIGTTGKVENAQIVLGHKILAEPTRQAALQWQFSASKQKQIVRLIFIFHDRASTSPKDSYSEQHPYVVEVFWEPILDNFGDKAKKKN